MPNPQLSVVVPSVNGLGDLVGCLEALDRERKDVALEAIVVDRMGDQVRDRVRALFPWVRVLPVPATTTIPRMRAEAFAIAQGDNVGVIEDHVIVPAGWAKAMLAELATGADVVGGTVENAATEKLVDWAAFLCEYSHCIPPLPDGDAEWLTGNNIVYRRALLDKYRGVIAEGAWENRLHDAMRADGIKLVCRPAIRVGHKKHYTVGEYLSQRYLYARSYAGARVANAPASKRAAYGMAAFALPPVLFSRTVTRVLAKKRHRAELARSLPLLALFVSAWAAGEIVGYWAGPGDSLSRVC